MKVQLKINKGYKKTPVGFIPKEWDVFRLGDICSHFKSGFGITSENIFDKGKYPVFGGNGLRGFTDSYTHDGKFVLIGRQGALCGNIQVVSGKVYISEHAIAVQTDIDNDTIYLAYKLYHKNLNRLSESSAQPGLAVSKLLRLKIDMPPLPEQQKIAEILTTWDEAIRITQESIVGVKKRNKGLAQELLTGTRRLFGFRNTDDFKRTRLGLEIPEDWSIACIGEVFNERNEKSCDLEKYPLYSLTIDEGITEKTERYERSFLLKDSAKNMYKVAHKDDIVFNPMNLRFGAIAKSNIGFKVTLSAYYNVVFSNSDSINVGFFERLFKTERFINLYERIAIGSLIEKKRVHLSNFLKIEIGIPPIEEQNEIAIILEKSDLELRLMYSKLESLQQQKKGLMQKLLTGQIRVNI